MHTTLQCCSLKLSSIFFLEDSFNFLEGVLFSYNGVESYMTAELAAVIADAKQHAEVACLKGASGTKCCPWCMNVVSNSATGQAKRNDGYHVGIDCFEADKFIRHTVETFNEMADQLEEAHGIVPQAHFKKMETACGLKYLRNGLPYDRRARSLAPYPRVLYWDWMHILVASGGVIPIRNK